MPSPSVLFVGLGSPHGDDRAGWLVAKALQERGLPGLEIKNAASPWDIPSWLPGHETLLVCDACQGLGMPGAWKRWSWPDSALTQLNRPQFQESSSHQVPLVSALRLAEILDLAPRTIAIWAIEAGHVAPGDDISPSVRHAIDEVTADISLEFADMYQSLESKDMNQSPTAASCGPVLMCTSVLGMAARQGVGGERLSSEDEARHRYEAPRPITAAVRVRS